MSDNGFVHTLAGPFALWQRLQPYQACSVGYSCKHQTVQTSATVQIYIHINSQPISATSISNSLHLYKNLRLTAGSAVTSNRESRFWAIDPNLYCINNTNNAHLNTLLALENVLRNKTGLNDVYPRTLLRHQLNGRLIKFNQKGKYLLIVSSPINGYKKKHADIHNEGVLTETL